MHLTHAQKGASPVLVARLPPRASFSRALQQRGQTTGQFLFSYQVVIMNRTTVQSPYFPLKKEPQALLLAYRRRPPPHVASAAMRRAPRQRRARVDDSVPPPPGWVTVGTGSSELSPPPGWPAAAMSGAPPRKRRRPRQAWVSLGRSSPGDMMEFELKFEVFQMLAVADEADVHVAYRSSEDRDRKQNPWVPVGANTNTSPSSARSILRSTIRSLDRGSLTHLYGTLRGRTSIKARCEAGSGGPPLPDELWARALSFLDFQTVWTSVAGVSRRCLRAATSASFMAHVRALRLTRFPKVADLGALFRRLPALESADFSAGHPPLSAALGAPWPTASHTSISDHVIRHLSACKALRSLDLSRCEALTDRGFLYMASSCHALSHLDLGDCVNITDRCLKHLAFGCRGLEFLSVRGCYMVTDEGLAALAGDCRRLQQVILRRCFRVTDLGLKTLARGLAHALRKIDLHACDRVTDSGMVALAKHCQELRWLDIGGCVRVGDRGVMALAGACNGLRYINLYRTTTSVAPLPALIKGCPRLDFLGLVDTRVPETEAEVWAKRVR